MNLAVQLSMRDPSASYSRTDNLRVALFSGNYNYHMDGPVKALNRLVGYLQRQSIPTLVFAPTTDTPACEPTGTLISVPSLPLPGRSEYRLGLGLPSAIRRIVSGFRPTLFHLAAPDWTGYAALQFAKARKIPAVASYHTRFDTYLPYYGGGFLQRGAQAYLRSFYHQCDQLLAPSQSMADVLKEQRMCDDIRIWGRGVDRKMFDPAHRSLEWRRGLGLKDEDVVIAFVGRVVMEKGLDRFAATLNLLRNKGIAHRALIIGEGPAEDWLRERLPDAVFTGYLKGDDLSRGYASADIFFNPSTTETFGNVTAEAMASGLATVCADATGSRSLVLHGETGFLCPADDFGAYAAVIARLITDADLRAQFGAEARERTKAYDWERILESVVRHYLDAITAPVQTAESLSLDSGWTSPALQGREI